MNRLLLLCVFIFGETLMFAQNVVIDGVTFSADKKTLIKYPEDKECEHYIVPEGTEVIGEKAFMYTKYLKILSLPFSLKEINEWAFGYSSIETINWRIFPEKIVGEYIFGYNNSQIVTFGVLDEGNCNCISIDDILFSKDKKTLLCFPPKKIGNRLSGRYVVPEGVEVIAKNAFSGAEVSEVVLPSSLNRIEDHAFFVSWITITGISNITDRTLSKIYCNAIIPPAVIGDAFFAQNKIDLYVNEESYDAYRSSEFWKNFKLINGASGVIKNQIETAVSEVWVKNNVLYLESEKKVEKIEIYNTNGVRIWCEYVGNENWQLEIFKLPLNLLLIKVFSEDCNIEIFKLLNRNTR